MQAKKWRRYTSENRLASGPNGTTLGYDALGRLSEYDTATTTTRFVYDGDVPVAEVAYSGATLRRYVFGPGADEPLVWYEGADLADRRWLVADERGSIMAVAAPASVGNKVNTYDSYGTPAATNTGRFQYAGQMWLPEAGLYHDKARAYSPALGRFLQTDPIGIAGGLNLYNYVGSDPVNGRDPSGLATPKEKPVVVPDQPPTGSHICCGTGIAGGGSGFSGANAIGFLAVSGGGAFVHATVLVVPGRVSYDAATNTVTVVANSYQLTGSYNFGSAYALGSYLYQRYPLTSRIVAGVGIGAACVFGGCEAIAAIGAGALAVETGEELGGTAIVNTFAASHANITVAYAGESLTTGLSNVGGIGTVFVEGAEGATGSVTIPLPNAQAATAFAQRAIGPGSAYNLSTNSCVTYCGQVLRAGGADGVPGTTRGIINFLGLGQ